MADLRDLTPYQRCTRYVVSRRELCSMALEALNLVILSPWVLQSPKRREVADRVFVVARSSELE